MFQALQLLAVLCATLFAGAALYAVLEPSAPDPPRSRPRRPLLPHSFSSVANVVASFCLCRAYFGIEQPLKSHRPTRRTRAKVFPVGLGGSSPKFRGHRRLHHLQRFFQRNGAGIHRAVQASALGEVPVNEVDIAKGCPELCPDDTPAALRIAFVRGLARSGQPPTFQLGARHLGASIKWRGGWCLGLSTAGINHRCANQPEGSDPHTSRPFSHAVPHRSYLVAATGARPR
jgi:hypothetical protein